MPDAKEIFEELKAKVFAKKPVLAEIIRKRGQKKLYDYAQEYIDVNSNPTIKRRQNEFLDTLHLQIESLLGKEVADSARNQLKKHYYVSTVDHHGPICHPFFINGNILTMAPYFDSSDPDLKNVIVLACANVSLNNSSHPRGLLFNTYQDEKIQTQRISFFPASERLRPVFNMPAYKKADIERAQSVIRNDITNRKLPSEAGEKVLSILDDIYLQPENLARANFSDQITTTNFQLWPRFFTSSNITPPNLIYLEQETLVLRLLKEHHIFKDTIIRHFLFDTAYDPMIEHYFEGIQGAFSKKEQWGTWLFWGLPPGARYRIQLWKNGEYLESSDGSYRLHMTPENLIAAFERQELIPSSMLCYILLSSYYGLKCLGGFSQVNYLTFMKNAYIKMQADLGNYRSIEMCARSQTKEMGGDFTIAFLAGQKGEMVPATGLDLILYGHEKTWSVILEETHQITLEEAIGPLMPEFYRIVYPEPERDPVLLSLTAEDITHLTGLEKKIAPCATL